MQKTQTSVLIDLTIDRHTAKISLPELNVSIVSHAAKYFSNDRDKIAHMLQLMSQILSEQKAKH